ncbi:MAG: hypothetical protein RIQ78_538 [Bacteroidota bacterium]
MCRISTLAHFGIDFKKCRAHRYDHISLLHFCPGEVLQELVARHAAKIHVVLAIIENTDRKV